MLESQYIESLISVVSAMNRDTLLERFHDFRGSFPVDFTPEYLRQLSTDRLRHIYIALCLQAGQLPVDCIADAA